jgi:hypothetical protein
MMRSRGAFCYPCLADNVAWGTDIELLLEAKAKARGETAQSET